MKASKSGTVKAIALQAGLLVESMSYPAVLGYTENEVYLDKLAITLSPHLEHPHHTVAVVVEAFNDDSANCTF
jgi:hypothetical protein